MVLSATTWYLVAIKMSPKRFVIVFALFIGAGLTTCALFNFIVNPYAQYPSTLVLPLVHTSRSTKVSKLDQHDTAPEGLLLGSSRVMKLQPEYLASELGCKDFYNAGVFFGKQEDNLAMLRFYRERFGTSPKILVMGVDVHGFNDGIKTDARLLNNPQMARQIQDIIPLKDRFQGVKGLVAWNQTKASIKSVVQAIRPKDEATANEVFNPDGWVIYPQKEQEIADGVYDLAPNLSYSKKEYKFLMSGYETLSQRRIEIFLSLIDECQQSGTKVFVFLTPLHPELADYLAESTVYPDRRADVIDLLESESAAHNFAFCDLSTIETFGGSATNFIDGIHPLQGNTRLMIDRIAESAVGQ